MNMFIKPHWIIMVLAAVGMSGCTEEKTPKKPMIRLVNAIRVADSSGLTQRAFPGRARAGQEVNLSFRVAGPLIAFPAAVGKKVKRRDVVARIDPRDFETALRTVEGQLERENARVTRAQADLKRLENIFKEDPGATSKAAIDRARQIRDSARANMKSLRASVATVKNRLSYTYLKAPFAGVIVETYVENFETVVPRQPILRVLNPSSIEFIISVPETLISYAPYVKEILVRFDALPGQDISAKVKEIGKEASQATRTYPVTLVMDQPKGVEILPGMAGEALVTSMLPEKSKETGIEIPATAVFSQDDPTKSYVWIVDEATKTLSRRKVQVGQLARFGVLIRSGLKPGEWIVVKGVHSVKEGEEVRIIDNTRQEKTS